MTTPGGVFIRRSEFDDQPGIQALIGQEAEQVAKRFRHVDVTNMIENASLGITAVDEKGAVVGYAAFYDFPALTSEVDPVAWPEWLHGAFGHPEFTEANTAFLSFFLAVDELVASNSFALTQCFVLVSEFGTFVGQVARSAFWPRST